MLNFLKDFRKTDISKYEYNIRNTNVTFYLNDATSMDDNRFSIINPVIHATINAVTWDTVLQIINLTDPVNETTNLPKLTNVK